MKKNFLIFTFFVCLIFSIKLVFASIEKQSRIISLSPGTTEILFALGLDEEIVGVSTFCDYPALSQTKPKVGTFSSPNMEVIVSLKPDIVFSTGLEQALAVKELKQLKLNVFVSDPSNIAQLFESIKKIGELTGREKEAQGLISRMKNDIDEVNSKRAALSFSLKPKVFIEIWHSPLMTAGSGSFIDELITLAGGENIAYDTKRPYSYFSEELLIKRDPDYIILGYMQTEVPQNSMKRRFGWENISAVKNNRLINDIDPDIILRPGPRITSGLKQLFERLALK